MLNSDFYEVFSQIDTPRLLIRKLVLSDAEDIFRISSNPNVSKYVLWDMHRSIVDSRSMVRINMRSYRNQEPASLAIVLKSSGRVIGTIGFLWIDREHNSAEIGYSLGEPYWNHGYMTEALRAMIEFGFEKLFLNRIEACFDVRNTASGRVMEKAGMQKEGVLRKRLYNKGKYIDVEMWSVLMEEYKQK